MGTITVKKIGITKLHTDAIVNAANDGLYQGGGVCGAIFAEAGADQLTKACREIGGCKTGNAVITPGFNLPAKYIIHAVGPVWSGGNYNEPKLLYSAYKQYLLLDKENGCHSIGFPLISAGIFGYPKNQAWRMAVQACYDFINDNDYEIDIIFAVLDEDILALGEETINDIVGSTASEDDDIKDLQQALMDEKPYLWCQKYELLFKLVYKDDELRKSLQGYSIYQAPKDHPEIYKILSECMHDAYSYNVVVSGYGSIIQENRISDQDVAKPSYEWVDSLSVEEILACIAWHFRRDHFSEGSWISDSVANGHMLVLVQGFLVKWRELSTK